ncbi:MAG: type II toxin-antitoxin system PrlF family antitoxin [Gammaproteobacteria bacterium]|nr:type II toxin-antitoxin system PrlF family antitoxin [Gammaproteobacteria bacterium]
MNEFTATVTQRSQVTIPAQVRRVLGIGPRDKVAFTIENDTVRLRPAAFTLESVFGSIGPSAQPEDFDRILEEAKEAKALRTIRGMEA